MFLALSCGTEVDAVEAFAYFCCENSSCITNPYVYLRMSENQNQALSCKSPFLLKFFLCKLVGVF